MKGWAPTLVHLQIGVGGAPNPSMQTKFKVFVGVRSGRKGPVMDLSIVGLESLSKQNLRFALGYIQSEPKGPVIHSSICGGAPGRLGNMLKHSTVWRPQCLSNQNLKFEVCVGVRSGPKGPVTDFSTFGLESLFKQNLKLALAYILGRRACH